MDDLRVTMTLTVKEWREIIAGLTCQSFNGREEAEALNQKIASFVAAVVSWQDNYNEEA